MYPAYTQLVAKWSSPSIGDARATGCTNCYRLIVPILTQYTASSSRNAQLSQLDLVFF